MIDQKIVLDILNNTEGNVRGVVFKTDANYIKEKLGKDKVQLLQKALNEANVPIEFDGKINATNWYPLSWRVLSIVFIKDLFDWSDKDVFEMGVSAPKYSFIVRTLLRYFISLEKTFAESAKYWKEHYSIGELVVPDPSVVKDNYLVFQLKNFKIHPFLCEYYKGYFMSISKIILKADNISIEETKCMFKNDDYHEFKVIW